MKIVINVLPSGERIFALPGERLLDILANGNILITAPCGGKGTCGKCKIENLVFPTRYVKGFKRVFLR